jgi:hypothetical protein
VNSTSEDSRRESTDWFGRLASNTPVETPALQPEPTISSATDVIPESSYPNTVLPTSSQAIPQAQSPVDLVEKAKEPIESKVDFSNGYRAKALWSYSAVDMDHVSFDAGSYMRVYPSKEADNVDWVYGELEQDEQLKGWLPKAYTEQICEKFMAKAVFAYSAQNEGELSVEQGDIVQVLEKPDPQWWRARTSGGSIGMLPATYLEEYIESQIPAVELPVGKAKALYLYTGQSTVELSVEVDDQVDIMEKPDPLWWRVRNARGDSGMVPASYLVEVDEHSTSG